MVKYTKRCYRKSNKVSKRQFNYIASHYLKYKVKNAFQVNFNQQNGLTGDTSLTFQNILDSGSNDFGALSKHFLQYKVTGVALTVMPMLNGEAGNQFNMKLCGFAMSVLNVNDDLTWEGVTKSPNCILVGNEKVTKYVRMNSGWFATNNQAVPSMKICTSSRGAPLAGQVTINFIVTMYISFKDPA